MTRSETIAAQLGALAVSGRFDPWLLLAGRDLAEAQALAEALSQICEEDTADPRCWNLRSGPRRELLAGLDNKAALNAALRQAPKPLPDDPFAAALRAMLTGKKLRELDRLAPDNAQVAARDAAVQFAQVCQAAPAQALGQANSQNQRAMLASRRAQSIAAVLPGRLYGRATPLRRIRSWADADRPDPPLLLVEGIGGIGKSALLAAAVRAWLRRGWQAIILDFDRSELARSTPLDFARELTRQLRTIWIANGSPAHRSAAEALVGIREQIASKIDQSNDQTELGVQYSYALSGVFEAMVQKIAPHVLAEPLLLVLDSFEVAGVVGQEAAATLLDLAKVLPVIAGMNGVRVLVGARECPLSESETATSPRSASAFFGPLSSRIRLGGLPPVEGGRFLSSLDRKQRFTDPAQATEAARALDGNPLALIVLERFARSRTQAEVDQALTDIKSDPGFRAQLAHSFLYRRILDRIGDKQIASLAHPGLVLREVTSDLIRLVLAGPCGLGELDQAEATTLLNKLAGEYWLVEREGTDRVRHRKELRRDMLPRLFDGPIATDTETDRKRKQALRSKVLKTCRAARDYYLHGPQQDDPAYPGWSAVAPADRRIEADYYAALAGAAPPHNWSQTDAARFVARLGEDFPTLPLPWTAAIKVLRGDPLESLTEAERLTLSGKLRATTTAAFVNAAIKQGDTRLAEQLASEAPSEGLDVLFSSGTAAPIDVATAEQLVAARFAAGDWSGAADAAATLFAAMQDDDAAQITLPSRDPRAAWWQLPLWQALLASAAVRGRLPKSPTNLPLAGMNDAAMLQLLGLLPTKELDGAYSQSLKNFVDSLRVALQAMRLPYQRQVEAYRLPATALRLLAPLPVAGRGWASWDKPDTAGILPPPLPSRPTLAQIEEAYANPQLEVMADSDTTAYTPAHWIALRGLSPELHAPLANLVNALPEPASLGLAERIASQALCWPLDLWFEGGGPPSELAKRRPWDSRMAHTLVLTADRAGLLRQLAAALPGTGGKGALQMLDWLDRRLIGMIDTSPK